MTALITGCSKYEIFQRHNYRYHLTAIGEPGPNLYIAKKISESSTDDIDTAQRITLKLEFKWFMSAEFRELRGLDGNEPQVVPITLEDEMKKEKNTP